MTPAPTDKNRAVRLAAAIVVMLSASMMTLAQQPGSNYVRVTEHLDAFGSQSRSTTTYYNGMGWPVETVQNGYKPQGTDIATQIEYDGNGRAVRQWERTAVSGYSNGESFTYDMMGNVTQIERRGMQDDDTYSPIDDLILTYDGNQLTHVEEYAEEEPATKGSMHFSQAAGSSAQYAWDANGNMTKDRNRGIESISYDVRNNPLRVTFEDGTYTDYTYDATGRKLRSAHPPIQGHSLLDPITINGGAVTQGAGNEINGGGLHDPGGPGGGIVGPIVPSYQGDTIEYCGNTVVVNGEVNRVAHDKGYITFDEAGDPLFHYYLRDHLGSVREVFNEEDSTEQVNHYYASGALKDVSTGSAEQPLKYNGKELLREWGMDAYRQPFYTSQPQNFAYQRFFP